MKKKRKSRFQQRLEEMQLKHNVKPGDSGPGKVRLHNEDNPPTEEDPRGRGNQTAQSWGEWISVLDELPPYYMSVDIYSGLHIMENWARVSHGGERDGKDDFYVNNRDSNVAHNITYWRKRPDVNYVSYDPMTTHDVPILSTNDVNDLIKELEKEEGHGDSIDFDMAINWVKVVIKRTLQEKTRTSLGRAESSIPRSNTGG